MVYVAFKVYEVLGLLGVPPPQVGIHFDFSLFAYKNHKRDVKSYDFGEKLNFLLTKWLECANLYTTRGLANTN